MESPANFEKKKKIVFVEDETAVDAEARDVGGAKMHAAKDELKGVGGFFKKFWKHNLFHEYYRQKEINKAKEEILKTGNLYANETDDKKAHNQAMQATVERFASDYDEAIHKEAGESREILGDAEADKNIKAEVQQLIKNYATGSLDDNNFVESKNRIFSTLKGFSAEKVGKGSLYADNMLEIAKQAKQAIEHGQKLEELDLDFDIVVGNAKTGVRTEAHMRVVDRLVDKISKSKVGQFVNETTLTSAVALAYSVTKGVSQRVSSSKALAYGTLGASAVLAGGIAGLKESKRLEEERRQHARDMAKGKQFDAENSPRRLDMEKFRYETKDAAGIAETLEQGIYHTKEDGTKEVKELTQEQFDSTLANLADLEARIKLSDRQKIDLISYSDTKRVEQERLRLDILRARAKVELRNLTNQGKFKLAGGKNLDETLEAMSSVTMDQLTNGDSGIAKKNAMFKKMKHKEVTKAVLKGVGTGLVVGGTVQEVMSWFNSNQVGVVEGLMGKGHTTSGAPVHLTSIESLRRAIMGDMPRMDSGNVHEVIMGNAHYKLPEGVDLIKNSDGTFGLSRGGDVIADHLSANADGSLSQEAGKALTDSGVIASTTVEHINATTTETVAHSTKEFVQNHVKLTNNVHRTLWYDNDTPKPVFDKNELKLWWGGDKGTGIDAHGNYVFNMKHMMPDGSYHGKFSVDALKAMAEGKLKLLLSLSEDTQNQVVEIPIDANGNAVIDPNSEIGKAFFQNAGGHAKFLGKFAEVAEMLGKKGDVDQVRLLATHVGEGIDKVTDTIVHDVVKDVPTTMLDVPADYIVDPPPVIPIWGRRPLEPTTGGLEPMPYYAYGYKMDNERRQSYESRFSAALKENPDAKLNHVTEVEEYFDRQSKEYNKFVDELAHDMGPMNKDCRLSVCIPVAGHQEGPNIYKSLENYLYQTADKSKFELNLLVNHPDKDLSGNIVESDDTLEEIERFKRDHPETNINVAYRVIPTEKAKIGYIRKLLSDSTLKRHASRGKGAKDLILVSNDADNKGLAPEYIQNFIDKFDKNQNIDALLGQLDWDPESYVRNPLVHIGTRLFQYIDVQSREQGWYIGSSGANFAYRSSIYAGIDGYTPGLPGGEDTDLGEKIKLARSEARQHPGIVYAGTRVSRLYTSSRRAENAIRQGLAPIEQWDKGFSAFDDEVRKVKWENTGKPIDYNNKADTNHLVEELQGVINRTIARTKQWGGSTRDNTLIRSLGWLGVKFRTVDDYTIHITDASALLRGLQRYQTEAMEVMKRKTGKTDKIEVVSH